MLVLTRIAALLAVTVATGLTLASAVTSVAHAQCVVSLERGVWCSPVTLPYYFGRGLNNCLTGDCFAMRTAIITAADEWEVIAASDLGGAFSFQFAGTLGDGEVPSFGIVFTYEQLGYLTCSTWTPPADPPWCCGAPYYQEPFVAGHTAVRTIPGSPLDEIRIACVTFNDDCRWTDIGGDVDRLTIARHEIGHALGLSHTQCSGQLMSEYQTCNAPIGIDGSAIASAICLYGGDSGCRVYGVNADSVETSSGTIVLVKSTCDCSGGCPSDMKEVSPPTPVVNGSLRVMTYELAVGRPGGPYEVFASIGEADWVQNRYRHVFTSALDSVQVRMAVFEGGVPSGEAYSTHLISVSPVASVAGSESPEHPVARLEVFPNPSAQGTRVSVLLARDEGVSLNIYDSAGRLVRRLWSGEMAKGGHEVTWDGTDDRNERVAPGVYMVQCRSNGGVDTATVIRMR